MKYADVVTALYNLRTDKVQNRERPHKPLLLLALLDFIDAGLALENRFPINSALFETWTSYFELVRAGNDKPTVNYPIYYLSGDDIWTLATRSGHEDLYHEAKLKAPPSRRWLVENVTHGRLVPEIAAIVFLPTYRSALRKAIISRYFADHWNMILAPSKQNVARLSGTSTQAEIVSEEPSTQAARDAAFRRLIVQLYESRCAACELRLVAPDFNIVDAAHLIPWSESRNDHPTNGLALCKNHHWAMDRSILVPGPDRKWHISPVIDREPLDHRDLIALEGKPLPEPMEPAFRPAEKFLERRYREMAM